MLVDQARDDLPYQPELCLWQVDRVGAQQFILINYLAVCELRKAK
jgi:hypothetical protein